MTETRVTVAQDRAEKAARIAADLDERTEALIDVLGKSMSVERFKRVVVLAISKNPELLDCTRESIVRAIMEAAQDGLEPTGPAGGAHLVPFQNRTTGLLEAVLIRDYRGLVKMALRGDVSDVEARIVFEGDSLQMEMGSEPFVRYIPAFAMEGHERGGYRGVYTMLRFKDPSIPPHIDYMTMAEIDKVRDSTRSHGRRGPWADWYDEMAIKTAVRRALKLRATTPEMFEALAKEDALETAWDEPAVESVSERRERLVARLAPERLQATQTPDATEDAVSAIEGENEPPLAIVEAESLPAFPDLVEERDPSTCQDTSPIDGATCILEPDHAGIHRTEDQTWPK